MAMRLLLVTLLASLWSLHAAVADCADGVAALISIAAATTESHVREVLIRDLKQAELDLWEFDEVECATALAHAERLLRRQAAAANAGNFGNSKD